MITSENVNKREEERFQSFCEAYSRKMEGDPIDMKKFFKALWIFTGKMIKDHVPFIVASCLVLLATLMFFPVSRTIILIIFGLTVSAFLLVCFGFWLCEVYSMIRDNIINEIEIASKNWQEAKEVVETIKPKDKNPENLLTGSEPPTDTLLRAVNGSYSENR